MSWWRNKKRKPEKLEEPVDLLEIFSFIQKVLMQLKELKKEATSSPLDLSQLREENELLKMQISLLEKMIDKRNLDPS
jgi:hypothetical protein